MTINFNLLSFSIFLIALVSVAGVLSPFDYNFLPATQIFESIFFMLCMSLFFNAKDRVSVFLSVIAVIYICLKYVMSLFFYESYFLDFIQAYKAFIYISFMFGIVNSDFIPHKDFKRLLIIILIAMLVKYSYSVLLKIDDLQGDRPGVFTENNFELMMIIMFHSALFKIDKDLFKKLIPLVLFIVFLSSSRSAMLAYFVSVGVLLFPNRKEQLPVFILIFISTIFLMLYVFQERMTDDGFDSIDRLKLLHFFLYEIENWNFLNFIFGAPPLQDLSFFTCSSLPYYEKLFSLSGEQKCYSVILHSYIMRAIFDHGLLGLIFLISAVACFLFRSGFSIRLVFSVVCCILANATSVSSFNSVYVMLPMVFLCGLKRIDNGKY